MDKNKQQAVILAAVVAAFLAFLVLAIARPKAAKKPQAAPSPAVNTAAPAQKPSDRTATYKSAFPAWGRDPFAVGSIPVQATGDLSLSGIFWDAKKPVCLIDGKMLKVGDEISGARVLEISKDSVLLKVGDELRTLKVGR